MGFLDKLLGQPDPQAAPDPPVPDPAPPAAVPAVIGAADRSRTPREKVEFHIRRFTLALAQCEKGAERKAELRRNLKAWQLRLAALDLEEGRP